MKNDQILSSREEDISKHGKTDSKTHLKAEVKDEKETPVTRLIKKYSKTAIRTDIYSLEKIKLTLDDLLIEYCEAIGFRQKYGLTDTNNAIGIISILQALGVFILGMYYRFDEIKWIMAILVYSYFVINGIGLVVSYFLGGRIKFDKFEVSTRIDKIPVYVALLYWKNRLMPVKYHKDVFDLFNDKGELDYCMFLKDLEHFFNE